MTRNSIREYAEATRARYKVASKREKGVILDEFCKTIGHHRKAAIRLLCQPPRRTGRRRGRPAKYTPEIMPPLKLLWEVSGQLCSKLLVPLLPPLIEALQRHGEIALQPQVREQLQLISPATVDRLLKPYRRQVSRRPYTQSRSSTAIKNQVPLRTFGEWQNVSPGSLQADLVAHCGESTDGFYLSTLMTVDVATGWVNCRPVWGKGQQRVGTAVHNVRQSLPFELRELHTDNGGEFLNETLYPWCKREGIHFTRGRPYKKNDQAYAEQKNWTVVRRLVGYDRYSSKAAYEQLQRLYEPMRLYFNFFQPIRKLISKERVGAKVKKVYDEAQTPYERLLASGILDEAKQQKLRQLYLSLNPAQLKREIDDGLEALWKLAEKRVLSSKKQVAGG